MIHTVSIAPSAAKLVDADGRGSELPKTRSATHRARCTCGWRSAEYANELQAKKVGEVHARLRTKETT